MYFRSRVTIFARYDLLIYILIILKILFSFLAKLALNFIYFHLNWVLILSVTSNRGRRCKLFHSGGRLIINLIEAPLFVFMCFLYVLNFMNQMLLFTYLLKKFINLLLNINRIIRIFIYRGLAQK